ncbi:hypothetical protein IRP63_05335 [Clostridium botulinum]|uniref:hypothetical protein n=1 Tax=Clostridium botulinum TaxID=1491 RepID=UPI0002075141|nr:hypothetical protein [Clostridium botulinum]AEB75889.1 putative hypothetical protein [Clostridium botulinum BKT015925]MCD3196576.1 hypothetical protein [Clostridium botulinum C/D]MCD3202225.1 hypothetical protein [Clostridium botulinum C/D]MCD3209955.1 hypothetical protein [Clostridium botulinum C/D]MCD3213154.1 hypothetical protein [Clostridium botulinum C/D]
MAKINQKIDTILKFQFEIQENNIEKKIKKDSNLISSLTTKRKIRNYCIDKLGVY